MDASMRPEKLIELRNICKDYGSGSRTLRAVNNVTVEVTRGETVALVGESGSGKSTVAQCLSGLVKPTSGEIIFDGVDLTEVKGKALRAMRRRIGVVFQNPYSSLNPRMKLEAIIGEAVRLSRRLNSGGLRDAVVQHLLEVGLTAEHLDRYPHALSGGQRQRVAIARALALEPDALILDEPTSALDVSVQAQIMDLLAEVKRRKKLTYLFISHNLAVVEAIADNVVVMRRGEVIEQGSAQIVFQHPSHEYTKLLLNSAMSTDPDWQFIPPSPPERAIAL